MEQKNEGFPPLTDCSLLDWMSLFQWQCSPSPQRPKPEDAMTEEEKQSFLELVRQHQDEWLKLRRRHLQKWYVRNNLTEESEMVMENPTLEETEPVPNVLKYIMQ